MPQDDQDDFIELFDVQGYSGVLEELSENVKTVNGVNGVSLKTSKHQNPLTQVNDATVTLEITYDPYDTDRKQICFDIEDFDDVSGEVISA